MNRDCIHMRLQVEERYVLASSLCLLYMCDGEGTIQDVPIKKGKPCSFRRNGNAEIEGNMDVFLASYRNEED